MISVVELNTNRLKLRQWQDSDKIAFADLNADPDVMQYYPSILSLEESNELAEKIIDKMNTHGWGFWAVEKKEDKQFIGFVGLNEPTYELPVNPCVEIGWRLAKKHWGHGYATEAAKTCLKFAFETLNLENVFSFTSVSNLPSRRVMERLHMVNTKQNFEHPIIPENHILREHVLYKIDKKAWKTY